MSFTLAELATLEAALAKGVKRVKTADGKEVEYASINDMLALRSKMQQELGITDATKGNVVVNANTGLE